MPIFGLRPYDADHFHFSAAGILTPRAQLPYPTVETCKQAHREAHKKAISSPGLTAPNELPADSQHQLFNHVTKLS